MSHLNVPSISKWVAKLKADSLLALMIGVAHDEVPEVGNHYGLMNRLWLANPDSSDQDSLHTFRCKPRKKLAKNQKLPPFQITDCLVRSKIESSSPLRKARKW
ncbi:MAG TPA: hypothetical protein VFC58_06180 [Desulfosporosinus sp.]|nr:hypothetical protein [Desulfosporosinus sp.]